MKYLLLLIFILAGHIVAMDQDKIDLLAHYLNDDEQIGSPPSYSMDVWPTIEQKEIVKNIQIKSQNQNKCIICLRRFESHEQLLAHYIQSHPNKKLFVCEVCQQIYTLPGSLAKHRKDKHNLGNFKAAKHRYIATDDHKIGKDPEVSMNHFYSQQKKYLETVDAQEFTQALNSGISFKKTESASPNDNPKDFEISYLCDQKNCPEGFKTEREAFYHFVNEHRLKVRLICPFNNCTHSYFKEKSLSDHIQREHPSKPFSCYFCSNGEQYKNFADFKIHLQQNHLCN